MATGLRFSWRGPEVEMRLRKAQVRATEHVASDCVAMAKSLVNIDTGALQASIDAYPPEEHATGVSVVWGSIENDLRYSFWQEVLPEPRGKAYLRPSADVCYPRLVGYIREEFFV